MSEEKKWDFCGRAFNTEKQSLIEELVEREDTKIGIETAIQRQLTRLQKTSGKKRWSASKRPRNAIQTKVELLHNVIEPLVDFRERKQRQTAKFKQQKLLAKTTGTRKSTANDESYDDSAATTE